MARRGNHSSDETVPTTEEETVTVEAPVEEAPEVPGAVESADAGEADKPEPKPVDLTDFKAATEAAVAERDDSTGELPVASLEAVNTAYRAVEGIKGKNAAKSYIEDQMKSALMVDKDMQLARSYVSLKDNLSAGTGTSAAKAPADPTLAFVQKVVSLQVALSTLQADVPEGVNDDWSKQATDLDASVTAEVATLIEWSAAEDNDSDQPEVSPVARQAFKLSRSKTAGGSGRISNGGPRRNISNHIAQVFASKDVGDFLTINEIAKEASTEYGDDRPSAGAISAHLFPKNKDAYDDNGIKATAENGSARGATKVA